MSFLYDTFSEEQAIVVPDVFPKWEIGTPYEAGTIVGFGLNAVGDAQLYKCLQAHTSQIDWTPDIAVSLWSAIGISPSGYPEWAQPTSAADAYMMGDIVSYHGTLYQSRIDGNVWSPDAYPQGWEVYIERGD